MRPAPRKLAGATLFRTSICPEAGVKPSTRLSVPALLSLIAVIAAADSAGAIDAAGKAPAPLNLVASAKGAPSPPGWNANVRRNKGKRRTGSAGGNPDTGPVPAKPPREAAEGDAGEATGVLGGRSWPLAGKPSIGGGDDANDMTGAVSSKGGVAKPSGSAAKPAVPETDPAQFASNVADAATDARLAWQMSELLKV